MSVAVPTSPAIIMISAVVPVTVVVTVVMMVITAVAVIIVPMVTVFGIPAVADYNLVPTAFIIGVSLAVITVP